MPPPHGRDLKPTRAEAEQAVRTLIRWAGDDPSREGLKDTPGRVVRAYEEWFSGYAEEPDELAAAHVRGGRRLRRSRGPA